MTPETKILKVNNAPAVALVHHFVREFSRTRTQHRGTRTRTRSIQYSNPTYWSASYREPPRSTIGIAAVRTAIEYEYRFTEYRFAEYEYDEIRCEAQNAHNHPAGASDFPFQKRPIRPLGCIVLLRCLACVGVSGPFAAVFAILDKRLPARRHRISQVYRLSSAIVYCLPCVLVADSQ